MRVTILIQNTIAATDDEIVLVTILNVFSFDSLVESLSAFGYSDGVQINWTDKEPEVIICFPGICSQHGGYFACVIGSVLIIVSHGKRCTRVKFAVPLRCAERQNERRRLERRLHSKLDNVESVGGLCFGLALQRTRQFDIENLGSVEQVLMLIVKVTSHAEITVGIGGLNVGRVVLVSRRRKLYLTVYERVAA